MKMAILSKVIYTFQCYSHQATTDFHMEPRRSPYSQDILSKKNKNGGIMLPDFKLYPKAAVTKTPWYWYQNQYTDPWNTTEASGITLHIYIHLIFDKPEQKQTMDKGFPI